MAFNITGEVVELPGGALGFAAGVEYREHDGSFRPDPVAATGETAGIPAGPTAGDFDVTEFGGAAREDFTFTDPCNDFLGLAGSGAGGRDTAQPADVVAACQSLGIPETFVQSNPQVSAVSRETRIFRRRRLTTTRLVWFTARTGLMIRAKRTH